MAESVDIPFSSIENDDLLSLHHNNLTPRTFNSDYDKRIINVIENEFNELNLNIDPHDDLGRLATSQYFTEKSFKSHLKTNSHNDTVPLLHLNIRSANKNFNQLRSLIENTQLPKSSIIGLTETWFSQTPSSLFSLKDYNLIVNNRVNKIGGGVAMYIPDQYDYTVISNLSTMSEDMESLFIELKVPTSKNITLGIMYRPPQSDHANFVDTLHDLLLDTAIKDNLCVIMGDFNIDLVNSASNNSSQEFLETFLASSFLPLITKPTRVAHTSATIIDNIFTNILPVPKAGIILSDISDHFAIFAHLQLKITTNKSKELSTYRKYTEDNISNLIEHLRSADWSNILESDDANESYNLFSDKLTSSLDTHIPLQKKKHNYKRIPVHPWITKSLLRSINRKNNLYYKYISKRDETSKNKYTSYKNILTTLLRVSKREYYSSQLKTYKNDMKNTWKIINNVLNKNRKKSQISKINNEGTIVDDPTSIAETFNEYFSQIGSNLAKKVPQSNEPFYEYLDNPNQHSLFFTPTNEDEIINIIKNLQVKKSAGPDDIPNSLLKRIVGVIVCPLVHIFNLSLNTGRVPDKLKIAKVIPLFKKGDKQQVNNYRPISLLTALSKVLEKIVYTRTSEFLKKHNIFSNSQFGFRKKHSTTHAILSLLKKVSSSIDKYCHTVGIFLDFSKAFDTINHEILIHKLSHYGIRGKALEWFRNYLTDRKQFVSVNNHCSSTLHINCGVPQGSLLGPLLFIIYINDIQRSSNILSFILFADDSNLFYSHENVNQLLRTVNNELTQVTDWIKANKLSLNLQKTNFMLFSNRISELPGEITFDNTVLTGVSTCKFLGVFIDNKLSWKTHIDNLCTVISRNIGVINKLKFFLPSRTLLTLYHTMIEPYINYGVLAWGSAIETKLSKILLLQKKALRIISNKNYRDHTDILFFEKKILKINDVYLFQLGQFMYKLDKKELPAVFDDIFIKNDKIHNYNTRQRESYHLPLMRTKLAQNTFVFNGPKYWNSIENEIKQATSLHTFRLKLKQCLINSYAPPSANSRT